MTVTINGTKGVLVNGAYTETVKISSATTYAVNPADGTIHKLTPGGALTVSFDLLAEGQGVTLIIVPVGSITWPLGTKFFNGLAPAITAGAANVFSVVKAGGVVYLAFAGAMS